MQPDSASAQDDVSSYNAPRPAPAVVSSQRPAPRPPPSAGGAPRSTLSGILANKGGNAPIPPSLQAKMTAMLNRGSSASPGSASFSMDSAAQAMQRASINESSHPILQSSNSFTASQGSSSAITRARGRGGGVTAAGRRNKPGFRLSDMNPETGGGAIGAGLGAGRPSLAEARRGPSSFDTPFANFNRIVDPSGRLNFAGKAVLHASGVDFSNGISYDINMEQLVLEQELGRGNYGTVKKVLHLPTNVEMAMKEIRLELDSTKLNGILMELDILHRAEGSYIVEFYGAFFVESCVYYCMEYMDGGSLASLCCFPNGNVCLPPSLSSSPGSAWTSSPPPLADEHLCRIASSMTHGLEFLKTGLGVMHRDVKPTNVLVNSKGQVKLCDFGVSGQLEKSIAKTNVGCQSYMAPERIKGSSPSGSNMEDAFTSYTVSADVWSLGLSIVEIARGRYPYPPETYENVFAQLSAIVDGEAPGLPEDEEIADEEVEIHTQDNVLYGASPGQSSFMRKGKRRWSPEARDWVRRCLIKNADERATYKELLEHPWIKADRQRSVDMVSWVAKAIEWRDRGGR